MRGVVVDDSNLSRVATATVRLIQDDKPGQGTETDGAGHFFLTLPEAGAFRLEVSRLGYVTTRSQVFVVEPNDTVSVEFRVAPNALLMAPLTVTARSTRGRNTFERHKEGWGKGVFVTPAQIDSMHLETPADVFRDMEDVKLTWGFGELADGRRAPIPSVASQRGAGCLLYMLNRVWVNPPSSGPAGAGQGRAVQRSPTGDAAVQNRAVWTNYQLANMPSSDIAAVEAYRSYSEVPPELRRYTHKFPLSHCGLVIFWTKSAW